jgi:carboxypeptidase Taq
MTAYDDLQARFHRIGAIDGALSMLGWDEAVMMPDGGSEARAEQVATLRQIQHEMLTAPAVSDLIEVAAGDPLDPWPAANLREMRRRWRHATALPADLVGALSRATARCEMVWRTARKEDDFAGFKAPFATVLQLSREAMAAKAAAFGIDGYDALLDQYEPGMTADRLDTLFGELAEFLPDLLDRALAVQDERPQPLAPTGQFPIEAQRQLSVRLMQALGFDFNHGRLDVSHHPFTGGIPDDVRLTTRYREDEFAQAMMATLHETGHALYERGLPASWRHQPVGEARGMALHESQSLLVEMQLARGPAFIGFVAPLIREAFGVDGGPFTADNLRHWLTRVSPGLIRVEADEVCYPAHVMLRYRLEQALLSGDLAIDDLPGAWADGMMTLLGVEVPDDRDGCLQDIHWPGGAFGYFPTYTLGAMAAAQLFQAVREAIPDLDVRIGQGDFRPLFAWLGTHVHAQASFGTTDEILTRATGAPLSADAFRRHLEARYVGA